MNRLLTTAFILFCLELGVFLIVVPWTSLWDNNALIAYVPDLRPILLSNFFRGAVTGLGVIDCLLGLRELARMVRTFRVVGRTSD